MQTPLWQNLVSFCKDSPRGVPSEFVVLPGNNTSICFSLKSKSLRSRAFLSLLAACSLENKTSNPRGIVWLVQSFIRGCQSNLIPSIVRSKTLNSFSILSTSASVWLGFGPTKIKIASIRRDVLKNMFLSSLAAMLPLLSSSSSASQASCDFSCACCSCSIKKDMVCGPLVGQHKQSVTPSGTGLNVGIPDTSQFASWRISPIWFAVREQSPHMAGMITAFLPANRFNRCAGREISIDRGCACSSSATILDRRARLFDSKANNSCRSVKLVARSSSTCLAAKTLDATSHELVICVPAIPWLNVKADGMAWASPHTSIVTPIATAMAKYLSRRWCSASCFFLYNNTQSPMHPIDTNTAPKTSQQIQNQSQLKMNPTAAIKIMALTAQIAFALLLIFEIWMLFKIGDKMN